MRIQLHLLMNFHTNYLNFMQQNGQIASLKSLSMKLKTVLNQLTKQNLIQINMLP